MATAPSTRWWTTRRMLWWSGEGMPHEEQGSQLLGSMSGLLANNSSRSVPETGRYQQPSRFQSSPTAPTLLPPATMWASSSLW